MLTGPVGWNGHLTWNLVLPPSRPAYYELQVIEDVARPIERSCPVAVMGSTPEFRDLLARLGFSDITVIDSSPAFHSSMTSLVTERGPKPERLVQETWQAYFPTQAQRFALILSDLTLGNVPYEERVDLYRAVESALAAGGVFLDKVLTNEGSRWSPGEVRTRFKSKPYNLLTINEFNCEAVFCGTIGQGQILSASSVYDLLLEEFDDSSHMRAIIHACETITPRGMSWYYGQPWADVQETYVKRLRLARRIPQPKSSPYFDHAFQFIYVNE